MQRSYERSTRRPGTSNAMVSRRPVSVLTSLLSRPRPGRRVGLLSLMSGFLAGVLALPACATKSKPQGQSGESTVISSLDAPDVAEPSSDVPSPSLLQKKLAASTPARPMPPSDAQKRLSAALDQYFQRTATHRLYVHVDKPIYQPGQAIWFRVWELSTSTLTKGPSNHGVMVELVSPKGASVMQKRVQVTGGVATNDFALPATVQGGEYTIRVRSDLGGTIERNIIVSQYQPPRIKKKMTFLRKAYGAGDKVAAALSLHRATGEPMASTTAKAIVTVDEREHARFDVRTNDKGASIVRFALPPSMTRGDGLLTVLVDDGGVTESIQKRIPIVMNEMRVQLFPEGGDLVTGLPGRVYFSAKNLLDKPADIEGRVVDASNNQIVRFRSLHNGMGRFELTPTPDTAYFVEITKPAGITQRVPLPASHSEGCTMIAVDDPDNQRDDVRVGVWCSEPQTVIATAVLREKRLGEIAVEARPQAPTVVSLPVPIGAQGAIRVTLMNDDLQALAERLVYRGRGQDLNISIESDRASYSPRDSVVLTVQTTDLAGKPVQADLSLAVVDDTVLGFADDKKAHMLARLYLESEMPGQEIEEPNFYFSNKPKASRALDMVLGTQGWRRFEWQQVFAPPPATVTATGQVLNEAPVDLVLLAGGPEGADKGKEAAKPMEPRAAPRPKPQLRPENKPVVVGRKALQAGAHRVALGGKRAPARERNRRVMDGNIDRFMDADGIPDEKDEEWAGDELLVDNRWTWAPVRVFPTPNYDARYDGPRVDFRETIYWLSSLQTDKTGTAKARFYVSDAVTSFRATAEGVSTGGLPGRGEALIQSKLPVSLAVKMPLEVSQGDRIKLPITLTNETDRNYDVAIATQFGAAFRVGGGIPSSLSLKAGERNAFFADLEVVGTGKLPADGKALIAIDTSNLKDEVSRQIKVVPLGFPQAASFSGTLTASAAHEVDLRGALPGTIEASINLYPSPLATMVKGTEAMIREPYGCFEQASSANYPNIMVLAYLEQNDAAEPELVDKTMGVLDRGYKKLTGYESPKNGYEWFGGDPGHEALTAYGLMEFSDMAKVYGDVDKTMISRTAAWLKSRRDGKGGYLRDAKALDSFGRASEQVTNGYIAYALSEAGETDMSQELAYQKDIAKTTTDPYVMALAANILINLEREPPSSALTRLIGMQKSDGSFSGADHSITRSGGQALIIETTSLAALALIKAGQANTEPVRNAIDWLNRNRSGHGGFGSTQSTILSLRAMTAYADATRATQAGGTVSVWVNGKQAGTLTFEKGQRDALVFDDIAPSLAAGKNAIELRLDSEISLPYSVALSYRSKMPASSPEAPVSVSTTLSKSDVPLGEGVRMKVSVNNLRDKDVPMTLARIGLPGGLAFQNWQLDELKDKKRIDFYETREREIVLYFRSLGPKAIKDINLDLIARVPGTYVAPASRAYLYYTDEYKHWAEPVRITVK